MSNDYKQKFGIQRRNKKSCKGERGVGFKLTNDGNYDIDNRRLTNVAEPADHKDAINKNYFDNGIIRFSTSFQQVFLRKNEDIDMNGKGIKNLSWPHDNNDAVPKKYLYHYGLLFDGKSNSYNAKDKKIANVLDPEDLQDVVTKNSMIQEISKLRVYIDGKINSTARFTSMFYSLELSSITAPSFDIIDKLYVIQVSSHMWLLSGIIKPKRAFTIGNQILITNLPKQFPKIVQTKYFIYFKRNINEQKVIVDTGFITLQNELHLFLPLELQDMIIFDSILYIL